MAVKAVYFCYDFVQASRRGGRLENFFSFTAFLRHKWKIPKENNVTESIIDVDKWATCVNVVTTTVVFGGSNPPLPSNR